MSNLSQNKIYQKAIIINSKKFLKDNIPTFSDILSIPSNPEDIFTLISPIGHGAFGSVYKAIHKETKKVYAIKIIQYFKDEPFLLSNIKHMENINFCYKTVQEETSLMRLVNSSNYIVKYFGSYFSRKTNTLWLILEYCESGSVIDLMLAMDRTYTEIEIATIIKMVLKGLIIIHEKNLIHRDVKGANILLSGEGFAKIGDFGVGVQLLQEDFRKSKKGSPYWMSPQVVNNDKYGIGTDIWSLGVTCLELYNGEPPNSYLKPNEVMEKIGKCKIDFNELFGNKNMSESFKNFLKKCFVIEEKKRAKAKDLLNDEFIVKYSKDNELLKELYNRHINDLEEYRKEVEEYELELKVKQKKEYEKQVIIQQQKEKQNMSIECGYPQDFKEEIKTDINNKDNNLDKDNDNDEEVLFNKSINSLFFKDSSDKDNKNETPKKNKDSIKKETNNSFKYYDINDDTDEYKSPSNLTSNNNNIFDKDDQMLFNERYNVIYNNTTDIKKDNNYSSDIVNLSSNIFQNINLNNKSINIREYSSQSNISNLSVDKIRKNIQKNSGIKKGIKCTVINLNQPIMSRQKNNLDENDFLNKTMENKKNCFFEINEDLMLSSENSNKTKKDNRKSMNLINNIKSLSILSNNKVMKNKNKKNSIEQYRPIKTEENICRKKISSFSNIITKSVKPQKGNTQEINSFKMNRTTDFSNTNDNSNSKPNSNFNTNNNNSKMSNNANSTNSVYTKKIYTHNLMIVNKDNNICNNYNTNIFKINNKIPKANKSFKSFSEINNNILEKKKKFDINNRIQKNIQKIKLENISDFNDKKEDINDSDDDGIINKVKNFGDNHEFNLKENKENIDTNKKIENADINDNSNITSRSNHSYSVIESIEIMPSMNKNNIFSYAHKKYFS